MSVCLSVFAWAMDDLRVLVGICLFVVTEPLNISALAFASSPTA